MERDEARGGCGDEQAGEWVFVRVEVMVLVWIAMRVSICSGGGVKYWRGVFVAIVGYEGIKWGPGMSIEVG